MNSFDLFEVFAVEGVCRRWVCQAQSGTSLSLIDRRKIRRDGPPLMKKVSCKSRAGCCCGTNRESKFQKHDSTNRFVGISRNLIKHRSAYVYHSLAVRAYPISKKILRNSSRTFINGCRAPDVGAAPSAAKLYFLKLADFQFPLQARVITR